MSGGHIVGAGVKVGSLVGGCDCQGRIGIAPGKEDFGAVVGAADLGRHVLGYHVGGAPGSTAPVHIRYVNSIPDTVVQGDVHDGVPGGEKYAVGIVAVAHRDRAMRIAIHINRKIHVKGSTGNVVGGDVGADTTELANVYLLGAGPGGATIGGVVEDRVECVVGGCSRNMGEHTDPSVLTARIKGNVEVGGVCIAVVEDVEGRGEGGVLGPDDIGGAIPGTFQNAVSGDGSAAPDCIYAEVFARPGLGHAAGDEGIGDCRLIVVLGRAGEVESGDAADIAIPGGVDGGGLVDHIGIGRTGVVRWIVDGSAGIAGGIGSVDGGRIDHPAVEGPGGSAVGGIVHPKLSAMSAKLGGVVAVNEYHGVEVIVNRDGIAFGKDDGKNIGSGSVVVDGGTRIACIRRRRGDDSRSGGLPQGVRRSI